MSSKFSLYKTIDNQNLENIIEDYDHTDLNVGDLTATTANITTANITTANTTTDNITNANITNLNLTNQLSLPDGLLSAPSLNFTTNTDTGLNWNGSDLCLVRDGNDILCLDSSNRALLGQNYSFAFRRSTDGTPIHFIRSDDGLTYNTNDWVFQQTSGNRSIIMELDTGSANGLKLVHDFTSTNHFLVLKNSTTEVFKINSSTDQILIPDGLVSAPSLSFLDDTNTGIYSPATDKLAVAVNGADALVVEENQILVPDGSVSLQKPSIAFVDDPDTGFVRTNVDQFGVMIGGVLKANFTSTSFNMAENVEILSGSLGDLPLSFQPDTDTGIYNPSNGILAIVSNGVESARFTSTQISGPFGGEITGTSVSSVGAGFTSVTTNPLHHLTHNGLTKLLTSFNINIQASTTASFLFDLDLTTLQSMNTTATNSHHHTTHESHDDITHYAQNNGAGKILLSVKNNTAGAISTVLHLMSSFLHA